MNKDLLDYLEKPVLYQKSNEAFWDDDYISAQMLQAHLSQDTDTASRKISFIESLQNGSAAFCLPTVIRACWTLAADPGFTVNVYTG